MNDKNRKKGMQTITVMMFLVTLLVWVVLLCAKIFFFGLDWNDLLDDIISNILGILPPIIIFNFAYEYLTRQYTASEMSEQVTKTLMSDPEAIATFSDENKVKFIKTTMGTIVGKESEEMVNAVIDPYISRRYNIRRFFRYSITLRGYRGSDLFSENKYIKVYENLKYKKHFIESSGLPERFHIGFFSKEGELDTALRSQSYLFRENLTIAPEEYQKLLAMTDKQKEDFVRDEMSLAVYIDDVSCKLVGVTFTEHGIDAEFLSQHGESDRHGIEVSFAMPQLRGHSEFLVSINEPTFSPTIVLSYPEDALSVHAFSFMNYGVGSSVEAASRHAGNCEFYAQERWIYPMSGIVFVIDDLNAAP